MICKPDSRASLKALLIAAVLPCLSACGDATAAPAPTASTSGDPANSQDPDDPSYWVALARDRYRAGKHLAALEAADQALARGPDHGPALLLRALIVRDAHGFAASFPWFEAAITADPANADARAEYAAALGDAGQAGAMLAAVRDLAEIAPDDPRVFHLQAVLAARGHDWALSRSLLARSGMATRGVPAAMLLDAVIALEEGNSDSAAATLEALATRQPGNVRVRELLARALLTGGRAADVVARFGADAERGDASPYLMMMVARAHEQSGDRARAAPLLARAYGRAPDGAVVLVASDGLPPPTRDMRRMLDGGASASALSAAGSLQRRFPLSADAASLAGDASLASGQPQEALAAYARAAKVKRPWPLTRRAVFAYRRVGDAEAADTLLARHVTGEPNAASAVIALAERQAARGEWSRTEQLLDHAIALGSGHDLRVLALRRDAAKALGRAGEAESFARLEAVLRPPRLTP